MSPAAPRTPDLSRRNRRTLWVLLAVVGGLVAASFLLATFYFPRRRAHAPSELREQLKPRLNGAVELTPASDASAPAPAPAPGSAP